MSGSKGTTLSESLTDILYLQQDVVGDIIDVQEVAALPGLYFATQSVPNASFPNDITKATVWREMLCAP